MALCAYQSVQFLPTTNMSSGHWPLDPSGYGHMFAIQRVQWHQPLDRSRIQKLFRSMPLFWNSIFSKSSFNVKLDLQKIEYGVILTKTCMELEFMELDFHAKRHYRMKKKTQIQVWNSSSMNLSSMQVFFFLVSFGIT